MQRDYAITVSALALTANTTLYVAGLATGATIAVDLVELAFGCDATASGSMQVDLVKWTTDGTGTAFTPLAINGDAFLVPTIATAKTDYTTAPSGTITVLRSWVLVLPSGPFDVQMPLGREITVPASSFYGVRFTPTIAANGYCALIFEE